MSQHELVALTTDGGNHETPAGVAATASAGPYDPAELEALIEAAWSLEGDADPTRFDELLHAALVFLGRIALNPFPAERGLATQLLRSMEQRALWGPDHPVRQP